MSFISLVFWPFLFIYLTISAFVSQRQWLWTAAIASSIFYGFWDWHFLSLLDYVAFVSWYCAKRIASANTDRQKKLFVTLSVVSCLFVLGVFKYFNFFVDSFTNASSALGLSLHPEFAKIILPVGISFYTFHGISYTVDVYRKKLARPADLLSVIVYLSFFPQLVAGPIVRAHRFLPQIDRGPIFQPRKIKLGLLLMAWGYFLKVALADSISPVVDPIFASPQVATTGDLIFSIVGYSFQIYGDFAGYSYIAIGLAKLQGFDFPANFMAPYFSKSFSEFWRRWHISLSSFLRDYLYIPLGGNRHGKLKEQRNLFITMFLGGLWHGASYNFIIWGSLHGLYLSAQRVFKREGHVTSPRTLAYVPSALTDAVKILFVYVMVLLAWIFFRNRTFEGAMHFISGILAFQNVTSVRLKFQLIKVVILIFLTIGVDILFFDRRRLVPFRMNQWKIAASLAALCLLIEFFGSFGAGAFIYFQF